MHAISPWGPGYHFMSCGIHFLAGLVAAFWAAPYLWRVRTNDQLFYSFLMYLLSTVFLFWASGTFHVLYGFFPNHPISHFFHRLDHMGIGIYFLSTLTLIHLIYFKGWWRWGFIRWVWIVVLPGTFLRAAFANHLWGWGGLAFYMAMFSICLVTMYKVGAVHGIKRIYPLYIGTFLFVFFSVIERMKMPPVLIQGYFGPHEWFHLFINYNVLHFWWVLQKDANLFLDNQLPVGISIIGQKRGEHKVSHPI